MNTLLMQRNNKVVMSLSGRFDFNSHREYRDALKELMGYADAAAAFEVDLADVDYIDSSALGMLLLLRDKANQVNKPLVLTGARGNVRQVLEIANFPKIFKVA
ncbi:MAG: STAS domain-containing protein [Betaproteobacteria bacterium]|nr:STAS domain-containing protein [Betaproteobacteria bacterium]